MESSEQILLVCLKKKSQLYDIQNYKVVVAVVFTMKLLKTEGCFD